MFSPLILICTLSGQCHTAPAPVFETREQCMAATQAYTQTLPLPPETIIVQWTCYDWGKPA